MKSTKQKSTLSKTQAKHKGDQNNINKGTTGTNSTRQAVLKNRSKQLNPNNQLFAGKKKN